MAATEGGALVSVTARGVAEWPETSARGTFTKIRRPVTTRPISARTGPTSVRPCNRDTMTPLPPSKGIRVAWAGKPDTAGNSRSHLGHRVPDIVWSHVQSASDVYGEPQSVLIGLGVLSATACHSGDQ